MKELEQFWDKEEIGINDPIQDVVGAQPVTRDCSITPDAVDEDQTS